MTFLIPVGSLSAEFNFKLNNFIFYFPTFIKSLEHGANVFKGLREA